MQSSIVPIARKCCGAFFLIFKENFSVFQFVPSVLSLIWNTAEKSLAPSLLSFLHHIRLIKSFLTLPFSRMNSHSSFSTSPWSYTLIIFVAHFWTQFIFPFPFCTGKTSTGLGTSNVSHQSWVERKDPSHQLAGSTLPNAVQEVAFFSSRVSF